jgi:hypothetical protein
VFIGTYKFHFVDEKRRLISSEDKINSTSAGLNFRRQIRGSGGNLTLHHQASLLPKHLLAHIMATSLCTRSFVRATRSISRSNGAHSGLCSVRRRGFTEVAADDMTLPLTGYKVLDLTRVLAGVCYLLLLHYIYTNSTIAILHANPRRSRVCLPTL